MNEILTLPAVSVIEAIRKGTLNTREYSAACIKQLNENLKLNCFISCDSDKWLKAAENANTNTLLSGLPIGIKDNIDTRDFKTTGGCKALDSNRPERNATVVDMLIKAGAIIAGKTNMHELAQGITNNNSAYGAVRNPYDHNLIPGGSSGGTAAAIAAHIIPAGLGSDTGGSCRIPAALCNIVGFRPSIGRYPSDGIIPMSKTRDTIGPMARHVIDVALLDSIITGDEHLENIDLKNIRIGVPRSFFYAELESDVSFITEKALMILRNAGATLVEVDVPHLAELNQAASFPIVLYESLIDLQNYLVTINRTFADLVEGVASSDVKEILVSLLGDGAIEESVYRKAMTEFRPQLQKCYADYFNNNKLDCMIYPTTPLLAKPIGHDETVELNGEQVSTFLAYIRNTTPSTTADIPSLSIPAGLSKSGLPSGVCFDGPNGSDRKLFAIGIAFEKAKMQALNSY